jgi:spore coat protein U-like protein
MKLRNTLLILASLVASGMVNATTSTANLDISMTIGGGGGGGPCTVSTVGINFPWVDEFTPTTANGSISITCPSGIAYRIGLGGGLYSSTPPIRFIASAQLDKIEYFLSPISGGFATIWGNDDAFGAAIPGVGTGVNQDYTVYGGMSPLVLHSGNFNIGTWSDTVQVTVNY